MVPGSHAGIVTNREAPMTSSTATHRAATSPYGFRASLPDGREVELHPVPSARLEVRTPAGDEPAEPRAYLVAPMATPTAEQCLSLGIRSPVRWQVVDADEPDSDVIADGWFARFVGSPEGALLSLVVAPAYEGSGTARLLFETLVLTALEHRIARLHVVLPSHCDECIPVLERLGARVATGARRSIMASIDLAVGRRQLHASGPVWRERAAG
jgi:GNAT superfamily N-acetyltransferase